MVMACCIFICRFLPPIMVLIGCALDSPVALERTQALGKRLSEALSADASQAWKGCCFCRNREVRLLDQDRLRAQLSRMLLRV
jgi:hypothetical protein